MSTIDCIHHRSCSVIGGGCCARGLYGGSPSHGVCLRLCADRVPRHRGLGDRLAAQFARLRLDQAWHGWMAQRDDAAGWMRPDAQPRPTCGCARRQEALNLIFPVRAHAKLGLIDRLKMAVRSTFDR